MTPRHSRILESAIEDATPSVVPLADIEKYARAAGIVYPKTVQGWRWLYRFRQERGMEKCFLRVGRRIMVVLPAYREALRQQASRG